MPLPIVGDIIRVRHRWYDQGPEEEPKTLPCYVLAVDDEAGRMNLIPITPSKPRGNDQWAIAIDPAASKAAGLDERQSYLICDQTMRVKRPAQLQLGEVGKLEGVIMDEVRVVYRRAMVQAPRPARPQAPNRPRT